MHWCGETDQLCSKQFGAVSGDLIRLRGFEQHVGERTVCSNTTSQRFENWFQPHSSQKGSRVRWHPNHLRLEETFPSDVVPGISMPTHSSVLPSMHQHSWGALKVKISLTEGAARNFALNNSCFCMLSHTCVDQSGSNELLKQVVCDGASILIMSRQFPQGFDVPHPVLKHLWWYLYKVSFHICPTKSCKVSLESKHKRIFKALSKTTHAVKYISGPPLPHPQT